MKISLTMKDSLLLVLKKALFSRYYLKLSFFVVSAVDVMSQKLFN